MIKPLILFLVAAVVDPSITNIIGVMIGAIVTITMGIIAYKTVSLNKKFEAQTNKIDLTLRKTEVIEGHVNSERTAAAGKIAMLEKEISLLREMTADKTTTAALLAQAAATQPVTPAVQDSKEKL